MPAVISSLQRPDRDVTSVPPKHHSLLGSRTYSIALAALAVLAVVRFAFPRLLPSWTWLKSRRGRDSRKDYGRNVLARPSGFAALTAEARGLAQGHKQRQAVIWTTGWAMEKSRGVSSNAEGGSLRDAPAAGEAGRRSSSPASPGADGAERDGSTMDGASRSGPETTGMFDYAPPRHSMARPPPPPPLTPPSLSSAVFTFEDRRPSYAVSVPAELETAPAVSFIHRPNPDYTGSSTSADVVSSPSTPRRRSYTKTLPIGAPGSGSGQREARDAFAPSSFPPASPALPPPPPGHHEAALDGADGQGEIDVQGEIISVLDESGAGWKRHTRVYGGGVCLACMASGGGGFYGDKVPPEDRR